MIVVRNGSAQCRRLRDLRTGDQIVVGLRGIRVIPESKERDRLAFAFMVMADIAAPPGAVRTDQLPWFSTRTA